MKVLSWWTVFIIIDWDLNGWMTSDYWSSSKVTPYLNNQLVSTGHHINGQRQAWWTVSFVHQAGIFPTWWLAILTSNQVWKDSPWCLFLPVMRLGKASMLLSVIINVQKKILFKNLDSFHMEKFYIQSVLEAKCIEKKYQIYIK